MPTAEIPQLFGFHPNADITKNLGNAKIMLDSLLNIGEVEGTAPEKEDDDSEDQETKRTERSGISINGMM